MTRMRTMMIRNMMTISTMMMMMKMMIAPLPLPPPPPLRTTRPPNAHHPGLSLRMVPLAPSGGKAATYSVELFACTSLGTKTS